MARNRLRIGLVVGGFPTSDRPNRQVFNRVAAEGLAVDADVEVIFLRFWRLGRPLLSTTEESYGRLHVLAAPGVPFGVLPRLRSLALPLSLLSFQRFGGRLLRPVLERCDVIHSVDALVCGPVVSGWTRRRRQAHVAQVIGSDVNSLLPRCRSLPLVRGWERGLSAVTCNSRALVDVFRRLYPSFDGRVEAVYRGADLERFHPTGAAGGPLAGRPPVRFLFLGGLPEYGYLRSGRDTKGGKTLMRAWTAAEARLAQADASLLFAGPDGDHEIAAQWRRGLVSPERVTLQGILPPANLPQVYRSADVVIVPSLEEGLPNVAVEAAASGVAVLGCTVGGIPEVVVPGQTGWLVPPADPGALAEKLVEAAENAALVARLGAASRSRAERLFDRVGFASAMLAIYREVLGVGRP